MGNLDFLAETRRFLGQEAWLPALRASLFLFGVLGSFAWLHRRPRTSVFLQSLGGLLGLGYWLIQIAWPLGLGSDPTLTRQWAQAGVNAFAEPRGSGFVWGTPAETSLLALAASAGTPRPLLYAIPQLATLLGLGLVIVLPQTLIRNPTTAAFAASLALGGGLWPGISPYSSLALRPTRLLLLGAALALTFAMANRLSLRRRFKISRLKLSLGFVSVATMAQALSGGADWSGPSALLLMGGTIILATPLRASLRWASRSRGAACRLEALVLLACFGGSGLFWWDPIHTLPGFARSTDSGLALRAPLSWISQNVPSGNVIFASSDYNATIAALPGRRVLLGPPAGPGPAPSLPEPFRRARLAESILQGRPITRLAEAFSVTHVFLGPGELTPPLTQEGQADEPRLRLVLVYQDAEDFRILRLAGPESPRQNPPTDTNPMAESGRARSGRPAK